MRKLSPDSFVPSPSSPPVPSLSLSIYIYIHKYIYICIYTTADDNRQKLTAERAAIVDRGVETVNSHCTWHNVLLRFLFAPQSYTCFPSIHLLLPSFLRDPFLITRAFPRCLLDRSNYLVKPRGLMERAHLALLARPLSTCRN